MNMQAGGAVTAIKHTGVTIGKEELENARKTLEEFRAAKAPLNEEIKRNEQWYRRRHTTLTKTGRRTASLGCEGDSARDRVMGEEVEASSAYLFNAIQNFHADAMDNYPRANVLARSKEDVAEATKLSYILPALHDRIGLEKTYDRVMWCKGIQGWGFYSVLWDKHADFGAGEISVKKVKILNLYWDQEVEDFQESSDVFYVHQKRRGELKRAYPKVDFDRLDAEGREYERQLGNPRNNSSDKIDVVDWYYKKTAEDGRTLLHYCKFCGDVILYATENDPALSDRGLYDHGLYPFIPDVLYPLDGQVAGFGKISVGSNTQAYVDILSQAIVEMALWSCRPRYFEKEGTGLNDADFLDTSKQIIKVSGDLEGIQPMQMPQLDGNIIHLRDGLINMLNDNTNARSIATGSSSGGVTTASGLAILDQNQGKTGRDANRESFRAFREIVQMEIELIRQFYTDDHYFRVMDEITGETEYLAINNQGLLGKTDPRHTGLKAHPLFDLEITAEKANAYTRMANNELILSFFNAKFFDPGMGRQALACLKLMDFDRKEELVRMISRNMQDHEVREAVAEVLMTYATAIAEMSGEKGMESNVVDETRALVALYLGETAQPVQSEKAVQPVTEGIRTSFIGGKEHAAVQKARRETAEASSPV